MGLKLRVWRVAFLCILLLQSFVVADEEDDAAIFMDDLEERYSLECNAQTIANWDYMVDVNNATAEAEANDASVKYFNFQAEAAKNVSAYNYETYVDVTLYREFRFQKDQGPGGLNQENLTSYQTLQSGMETIYSTATICPMNETENCNLVLEPDIEEIMATSTDWDELKYVWEQWREVTGKLMRDDYISFVELSNQAAVLDGYPDTGDYWLNGYTVTQKEVDFYADNTLVPIDQEEFQSLAAEVWNDVSINLYKPLHAYVRLKLKELYPDHVDLVKAMPANILGNMWAQDWTNIAQHVMPFADQPDFDVTQSMIDNGWDIDKMFKAAEDFFVSVGLYEMTDDFWEKSVVNQTDWGKIMICHASAEDFCLGPNSTDFRIKMCTNVNMVDLVTVHHEMGHIEYFMSYRDLPHVFRDSANPGFHEAIGDLIALSVSTPEHMENVLGLTPTEPGKLSGKATNYTVEEQRDINFLMRMALEKIAFLPFGYLIDKYRWGIFDGSITSENLNEEWWNLRRSLQGVIPPSDDPRGEDYFDAGAKFHVPANVPYIRYFVSFIVQFQFHRRLCAAAGFEGPLHKCDIYNNTDAGNVLKSALDKGFSEPWPVILNELGGSYEMSADAIKEYFKPLTDFLAQELDGVFIGWDDGESTHDDLARYHLHLMDENMTIYTVQMVETSYTYNTDITDANAEAMNEASVEFSNVYRTWWNDFISIYPSEELSPFYQRQFLMQQSIGTAILDDGSLNELNYHLNMMNGNYTNRVCPFDNMDCKEETEGYDIDYLEKEMATNREYSELLYYWEKWRDNSGQNMIDDFKDYVDLMNLAAKNNSFSDAGVMWIEPYTTHGSSLDSPYDATNFKEDIQGLWSELADYYKKLHAYVSYKLKKHEDYTDYFEDDNLIPAHILGNMWAQSWENIYDLVEPYPNTTLPDISDLLKERNDTHEMFKIAEDFYYSLGLFNMTEDFWENSMFVNPYPKATAVCHASAWDFYSTDANNKENGRYRIKMCTDTNQEDFIVIHHEMGHIEYYMSYSNYYDMNHTSPNNPMPLIYRDGANPGFHEAIGDTIALSVSTTTHLNQIEQYFTDHPQNKKNVPVLQRKKKEVEAAPDPELQKINYLMKQALAKIPFLPYAYILDLWRWEVFNGTIKSDNYNKAWWEKRIDYQGVRPPISRSPDADFDIGCKYHVPASVPYIRYFVAYILQFQFHDKLCEFTDYTPEEIYKCDIYGNKEAGAALLGMLSKGASEHWQKQLGDFLETDGNMDASAIINYFGPLWKFLDDQKKEHNYDDGWKKSKDVIDDYINDDGEISAVVPIIVGVVLAVLVAIVLVAFFMGQRRRKRMEMEKEQELEKGSVKGSIKGSIKEKETEKVNEHVELEKGHYNEGLELQEKKEELYNES